MRTSAMLSTLTAAALAAFLAAPAAAFPGYFTTFQNLYPGSLTGTNVQSGIGTSCQLCHSYPSGGDGWNAYGWDVRVHIGNGLNITQALVAAEGTDSDLDPSGSSNLVEIQADTQPGWRVGLQNTFYFSDGSTLPGQLAPTGILGLLDPGQPAISFCPGDGTGNGCPCLNEGDPTRGCANSAGGGVLLDAAGSNSLSAADLVFQASGVVPGQPGMFFQGNTAMGGGTGIFFGDGLLCAGGAIVRLQLGFASGAGESATTVNLGAAGGVGAGQTFYYQFWYRDSLGPCGSGNNLSNGLEVTWAP